MTYTLTYSCSNCNHVFSVEINKGVRAPTNVSCPRCGCATGNKGGGWGPNRPVDDYPRPPLPLPTPVKPLPWWDRIPPREPRFRYVCLSESALV